MILINIPKDSASDSSVKLVELPKNNGNEVIIGEAICEYETSKSIIELLSEYNGFIYYLYEIGSTVEIGSPFCIISKRGLTSDEFSIKKKEILVSIKDNHNDRIISKKAKHLIKKYSIDIENFEEEVISEKIVKDFINQTEIVNEKIEKISFSDNDIIIYGLGGHAGMCIEIIRQNNKYSLVGFIDDNKSKDDKYNLKYCGTIDNLDYLIKSGLRNLIIGIGFINNLKKREKLFKLLKSKINIPTIIHNSAIIEESAEINEGCQIMAGAIIGTNVKINQNCIINSGTIISHDTIIGMSSHITPGAVIAGHVTIGKRVTIGMCATIFINLTINNDIVINNNENIIINR